MNDRARENGTTAAAERLLELVNLESFTNAYRGHADDVRIVAEAAMEVVRLREALEGLGW